MLCIRAFHPSAHYSVAQPRALTSCAFRHHNQFAFLHLSFLCSRANVVSNIITKLVAERGSVVLITAGGRAMHIAMMAVISARARLRAMMMMSSVNGGGGGSGSGSSSCPDILLLPRFVTVDTTNTLGWESVFLRFHIVLASPALLGSEPPQPLPQSLVVQGPTGNPAAGGMGRRPLEVQSQPPHPMMFGHAMPGSGNGGGSNSSNGMAFGGGHSALSRHSDPFCGGGGGSEASLHQQYSSQQYNQQQYNQDQVIQQMGQLGQYQPY